MKYISLLLIFFGMFFTTETNNGYAINFKCYDGFVFSENIDASFINGISQRFLPTKKEIDIIEKIIFQDIPKEKSANMKFGKKCPKIARNLKNYNRQYVGYLDANGNKIIWVNFIWKKNCPDNWQKNIILYTDGCSYFWQAKINLDERKVFDLYINGVA